MNELYFKIDFSLDDEKSKVFEDALDIFLSKLQENDIYAAGTMHEGKIK